MKRDHMDLSFDGICLKRSEIPGVDASFAVVLKDVTSAEISPLMPLGGEQCPLFVQIFLQCAQPEFEPQMLPPVDLLQTEISDEFGAFLNQRALIERPSKHSIST